MMNVPALGRGFDAPNREAHMERISTRDRILLRVGVVVAIVAGLWAFGLLQLYPVVVY
jgi:hypothetical protein